MSNWQDDLEQRFNNALYSDRKRAEYEAQCAARHSHAAHAGAGCLPALGMVMLIPVLAIAIPLMLIGGAIQSCSGPHVEVRRAELVTGAIGSMTNPARPQNPTDYDNLPVGTIYIDWDPNLQGFMKRKAGLPAPRAILVNPAGGT